MSIMILKLARFIFVQVTIPQGKLCLSHGHHGIGDTKTKGGGKYMIINNRNIRDMRY